MVIESDPRRDFINAVCLCSEKSGGMFQSNVQYEQAAAPISQLFYFTVCLGPAVAQLVYELLHVKMVVPDMLFNNLPGTR